MAPKCTYLKDLMYTWFEVLKNCCFPDTRTNNVNPNSLEAVFCILSVFPKLSVDNIRFLFIYICPLPSHRCGSSRSKKEYSVELCIIRGDILLNILLELIKLPCLKLLYFYIHTSVRWPGKAILFHDLIIQYKFYIWILFCIIHMYLKKDCFARGHLTLVWIQKF